MDTQKRLSYLKSNLPAGTDAALITSCYNRQYYTGMSSSDGTLLVFADEAYFIIDFRYVEKARGIVTAGKVLLQDKLYEQINELLKKHNAKTISVESEKTTLKELDELSKKLPDYQLITDRGLDKLIRGQRIIKDEEELKTLRQAQDITDSSFTHILDFIKAGKTEREVMLELEFYSRKIGSEGASFDFIVVSGANSSMPHGVPSDRAIASGDFLTMDFGCIVDGYHSDMTRTVAVGEPTDEMKRVYDTVLEANRVSMAAVKAGEKCCGIDKVARDIIYSAGYEGCFGHGLGHGVGLEIHEEPRFNVHDTTPCAPGMVLTIEPGIYLEGKFGCRIEDMVYVTENGCINITASKKELIVL